MNSIFVVIVHVLADQPTEMWFVQRDDVVENLSPATSHPSFRSSILPRRLYARPFGLQSRCLQEGDHFLIEKSNLDRKWHIDTDPLPGMLRAVVGPPIPL